MRRRGYLFWGFLLSVVLHGFFFFGLDPLLFKDTTPVIVSWLDLLSTGDLEDSYEHRVSLERELVEPDVSKDFFSALFPKSIFTYRVGSHGFFLSDETSFHPQPAQIVLPYRRISLAHLVDPESKRLSYRTGISSLGWVLVVTPVTLPLHASTQDYAREHLKSSLLRLGEDNFVWTNVQLVIK